MNCLKCNCGCDALSKEELEALSLSIEKVEDFIRNQMACNMLRRMANPDESVNRPKPNAIKYLEIVKTCEDFLNAPSVSDDDIEQLADSLPMDLGDELIDQAGDARKEVLKKVIGEYSKRLSEDELYKRFQDKVTQAYKGKIKLTK